MKFIGITPVRYASTRFPANGFETLRNINSPKVVIGKKRNALYFSRSVISCQHNADKAGWLQNHTCYKHIGLYAYRMEEFLKKLNQ